MNTNTSEIRNPRPRNSKISPYLKPDSANCECCGCGELFKTVSGFDMHRTGEGEDRRCMSIDEMKDNGMALNKGGYWVTEIWAEDVRLVVG